MAGRHRVVIVGGGFGGLCAARAPVAVTVVGRRNHDLFQPLLCRMATGGLSPANIAAPLGALVERQTNTTAGSGRFRDWRRWRCSRDATWRGS